MSHPPIGTDAQAPEANAAPAASDAMRVVAPAGITVSIVSHGQSALIVPLVEQLDRFSAASVHKLVLTANLPEADRLAGRRFAFPIERIVNTQPQGFGANHNAAFARCDSDWFLVLNPDVRFDTDVLAPLLVAAAPNAGVLTPRITEPERARPEPHRALLTPLEIVTRKRSGYRAPAEPSWIPGLFMLFRAEAYRTIGGFDTRFFMYAEDFDICARLRLAGWRVQVAEHLSACHAAQRASHARARYLYWHVSSLMRVWCSAAFWRYRAMLASEASAVAER